MVAVMAVMVVASWILVAEWALLMAADGIRISRLLRKVEALEARARLLSKRL